MFTISFCWICMNMYCSFLPRWTIPQGCGLEPVGPEKSEGAFMVLLCFSCVQDIMTMGPCPPKKTRSQKKRRWFMDIGQNWRRLENKIGKSSSFRFPNPSHQPHLSGHHGPWDTMGLGPAPTLGYRNCAGWQGQRWQCKQSLPLPGQHTLAPGQLNIDNQYFWYEKTASI